MSFSIIFTLIFVCICYLSTDNQFYSFYFKNNFKNHCGSQYSNFSDSEGLYKQCCVLMLPSMVCYAPQKNTLYSYPKGAVIYVSLLHCIKKTTYVSIPLRPKGP